METDNINNVDQDWYIYWIDLFEDKIRDWLQYYLWWLEWYCDENKE